MRLIILLLGTALFALTPNAILANTIAYQIDAPSSGSQDFGGSLGLDFDVGPLPIVISRIGVFDSGQDGFARDITAQLFSRDTATLIPGSTTAFTGADPGDLVGGSRFKSLGIVLPPGSYTINAFGYGPGEPNGNTGGPLNKSTNDGGGLITFVGGGRFGDPGAPGTFPGTPDGGPVNRYAAGTFQFTAIPEPSTICLLAASVAFVACFSRRRFCRA